ncbi:hypothetical protein BSNK01_17980 [Bacillaceae bacterium]
MKRFVLGTVYQPIVDHQEQTIYGYEALSRPSFKSRSIPPDIWFQAARKRGRSTEADLLAITSAVKSFVQVPEHAAAASLFVNVLPTSLMDETFRKGMDVILRDHSFNPHQLVMEIIEYIPYNPRSLASYLSPLRSLGIRIALDDMGVGSSNLQSFIELEPDYVKIDRSLVQGIAFSHAKQRLLSSLADLMSSANAVIAEGVEDVRDVFTLRSMGIHLSQGYYWAKPMPAEELSNVLAPMET